MKIKEGGGMDIQEAREAFERRQAKALNVPYEGLKAQFDENSRLFGARYNAGSINEKEWNLWLEAWQAKSQAVPEGFVLVPKEPTDEMWSSGIDAYTDAMEDNKALPAASINDIYKAMIEAWEPAND